MKTHTFYVAGTHCASCKILIEETLGGHEAVRSVSVNLREKTVEIATDSLREAAEFAAELAGAIRPHGYDLSTARAEEEKREESSMWMAFPLGLVILALFFALQKSGILNISIGGGVTGTTSFIIGLIASVSSCLAVVGGLVLSLSAKVSEDGASDTKNFILFHLGRIASFAVLGGVLGSLGSAIGINFTFTAVLGIIAAAVMILLGLNLTGLLSKNKITLPAGIFGFFRKIEHQTLTPLIVGFGTFFLPCGFTQSMQIAALGSGSFFAGALIMFAFAAGTLPALAFLSFGSASFAQSRHAPLFFKTAGVVVTGLGLFALLSGLVALGIINPLFNI